MTETQLVRAAQDALLATFDRLPKLNPDTLCFGAYATTATVTRRSSSAA